MNVTELARRLRLSVELTRRIIPRVGFDVGFKAIKVDDAIAQQIIDRVRKSPHVVEEVKEEMQGATATVQRTTVQTNEKRPIIIPESIAVRELAQLLQIQVTDVVKELIKNGIFATLNEDIDFATASIIAEDLGYTAVKPEKEQREVVKNNDITLLAGEEKNQRPRPPVVVIMGHVDHGKTSLLDAIRKTHVTEGESGGITQHIGAYQIEHKGKKITFIDTPGHEAFTAMRSRGATVADIGILVVAWDDGIKPQTVEALNIIKKLNLPFFVAVTKIDKEGFSEERILQQLAEKDLLPEKWGGSISTISVSAKTKQNLSELLDHILLMADVHGEKIMADPDKIGAGTIIESHIDKGEGPVATAIVQTGTLHTGDLVTAGQIAGRIKAMKNDLGKLQKDATPGTPVRILGLKSIPEVGDIIQATKDKKVLKNLLKVQSLRAQQIQERHSRIAQQVGEKTMDDNSKIRMILKTDNAGSLEAILESLEKLPQDEVKIQIVKKGVGNVTETDITEAAGTQSTIYAFHVDSTPAQATLTQQEHVEIRMFDVIYSLIEDVVKEIESRLPPKIERTAFGTMNVKALFREKGNVQIVGGMMSKGKVILNIMGDVIHNTKIRGSGKITEIRLGPRVVQEGQTGSECGVRIEKAPHISVGDVLEFYTETSTRRKLLS